jgi:N-acetylmuramoyl-L-alanine amidase
MGKKLYISGSTQENNVGVGEYGTEEYRMQILSDKVKWYIAQGKGDIQVFRNNGNMSLQNIINDSNAKNPDYHLALHSNAGVGGKGTECYYHYATQRDGKAWATAIYNEVAPLTVSSDRGVKADNTLYSMGLAELRETTAVACLIEIMFHDNITDVNDYLAKVDVIAKSIAVAIYKYFDMAYLDSIPVPIENKTEKEKVIEYVDGQKGWDLLYRMFNL